MKKTPALFAHALCVDYPSRRLGVPGAPFWVAPKPKRVLHDVALTVDAGEVVAVVGESGCGKSTLGRALTQLVRPQAGVVRLDDVILTDMWRRRWGRMVPTERLVALRRRLQMVFQDSAASLDPSQQVGRAIAEPMVIAGYGPKAARHQAVLALLDEVGLHTSVAERHPHALSGGQLQRINIARALAAKPSVLVADEPTSALDVSVKGQVLAMFERLVARRGVGLVIISHDLAAVRSLAQRVYVMYAGRVVESGPIAEVFAAPAHPYTQALIDAAPISDPVLQRARLHRARVAEAPQDPIHVGCPYQHLCPRRIERCATLLPALVEVGESHAAACIRAVPDGP